MSDLPKIPEHAKMRAFHGGYPDEPPTTVQRSGLATEWIGVVRDELVKAGLKAGDRTVALGHIRELLRDKARLDEIEWFGCNTGDCPHSKQSECDVALLGAVRSVLAERESARFLAAVASRPDSRPVTLSEEA